MRDKEIFVAFIEGRIQAELERLASGSPVSYIELANCVGNFLLSTTSGSILGTPNNLPPLRGKTGEGNKTSRKMEMARGTYRRKTSQARAKKQSGKKWTPEHRARFIETMRKKREQQEREAA